MSPRRRRIRSFTPSSPFPVLPDAAMGTPGPAPGDGEPPTAADLIAVRALLKENLDRDYIAQKLGVPLALVRRVAEVLGDSRHLAQDMIRSNAHVFAERIVRDADATESLEVCDRLGVLPRRELNQLDGGITIIFGSGVLPGCEPVQSRVIEVSPGTAQPGDVPTDTDR